LTSNGTRSFSPSRHLIIFEDLWEKGIDAKDRINHIEEGKEIDDELADAKQYVNMVLQVVHRMENSAAIRS
jgi:hypothetical protein